MGTGNRWNGRLSPLVTFQPLGLSPRLTAPDMVSSPDQRLEGMVERNGHLIDRWDPRIQNYNLLTNGRSTIHFPPSLSLPSPTSSLLTLTPFGSPVSEVEGSETVRYGRREDREMSMNGGEGGTWIIILTSPFASYPVPPSLSSAHFSYLTLSLPLSLLSLGQSVRQGEMVIEVREMIDPPSLSPSLPSLPSLRSLTDRPEGKE